jgi:hypothetical protein
VLDAKYFRPNYHRRNVIALHFHGICHRLDTLLPPYERWFLGGEQDLRGFDVRSVAPVAYVPIATATTFTYTDPTRLDITGLPTTQSIGIPTLAYQITFPGGDTQAVLSGVPHSHRGPRDLRIFHRRRNRGHRQARSTGAQFDKFREPKCAVSRIGAVPHAADCGEHEFPSEIVGRSRAGREFAGAQCAFPAVLVLQHATVGAADCGADERLQRSHKREARPAVRYVRMQILPQINNPLSIRRGSIATSRSERSDLP